MVRILGLVVMLVCLQGCAVGTSPNGKFLVGFPVNDAADSIGNALKPIAGILPEPFGTIFTGLLGAGMVGATGIAAHYRAKRNGERTGWDESRLESMGNSTSNLGGVHVDSVSNLPASSEKI